MKLINLCVISLTIFIAFVTHVKASSSEPNSLMMDYEVSNSQIPTSSNPPYVFFNANIISSFDIYAFYYYQFEFEKVGGDLEVNEIAIISSGPLNIVLDNVYHSSQSVLGYPLYISFNINQPDFIPGSEGDYILKFRYNTDMNDLFNEEWHETNEFEISIESPQLTGANEVCYSGQTTSITNYPTAVTGITWECSPLLTLPNGSTGFSVYAKAKKSFSTGSGWLKPSYIFPSGLTLQCVELQKWVGKPTHPITNPTGYPTYEMALGQFKTITVSSAPGASSNYYSWNVTGSIERVSSTPAMSCTIEATELGIGNFYVTSSNNCGTSPTGGGMVNVASGGGGGIIPLSLIPNPASTEIEIAIVDSPQVEDNFLQITSSDSELSESIAEFDLIVYNNYNIPVYNSKVYGATFNINVSSWSKGLYHIIMLGEDKKYSGSFIVK